MTIYMNDERKMIRFLKLVASNYLWFAEQLEEQWQRRQPPTEAALDKRVEDLELPVRAVNALKRAEIYTVHDLTRFTKQELHALPNLGAKTYREIVDVLETLNIELRSSKVGG